MAGAALYFVTRRASAALSPRVPAYRSLSPVDRKTWDCRAATVVHAVCITILSVAGLARLLADGGPPLAQRTCRTSYAALGLSQGYFVADLATVLRHVPSLGGWEMVGHHVAALASVATAGALGEAHAHTLALLATELTTPFNSARWYLEKAGMKASTAYAVNGACMLVSWAFARVALFPVFFHRVWQTRGELAAMHFASRFLITVVPVVLFALNLYWFSLIARGALKLCLGGGQGATKQADPAHVVQPSTVDPPKRVSAGPSPSLSALKTAVYVPVAADASRCHAPGRAGMATRLTPRGTASALAAG